MLKPELQQQICDDISNGMLKRKYSRRSLPQVAVDPTDVSSLNWQQRHIAHGFRLLLITYVFVTLLYFACGKGANYCYRRLIVCVCVSACLSARISIKHVSTLHEFFCMQPVAVACLPLTIMQYRT